MNNDIIVYRSVFPLLRAPQSDLLASLMSAMAMRILFLRKKSSNMMTTSTMARMITEKKGKRPQVLYKHMSSVVLWRLCGCVLTEGQPGLSNLQVD